MRLYTHRFSLIPWRVRIALHEKNIAYEMVEVDLFTGSPSPEFLELNPFAQIPVLDDGGFVLSESIAILEYLEETRPEPALLPEDLRARGAARMLMCWGTDYWPGAWKKWMAPRLPAGLGGPWTEASVEDGRAELRRHLDVLERRLTGNDWLVGAYSLADVCYAPLVLVLDRVGLGEIVSERRGVSAWVERLKTRKAIQDTMMQQL